MTSEIVCKIFFALFSIAIAAADIKTGAVPRFAFIAAFPFFFVFGLLQAEAHPAGAALTGTLLGFFVFTLAYFISGKKLGLADVWYSALIGLVLGPLGWYAAISGACVTGVIYIFVSKQRKIPFIPCMALGSIIINIIKI